MVSLGSEHSGFVRDCEERCDQSCLSAELGRSQEQAQPCQGVRLGDSHEAMFSRCVANLIVTVLPELK